MKISTRSIFWGNVEALDFLKLGASMLLAILVVTNRKPHSPTDPSYAMFHRAFERSSERSSDPGGYVYFKAIQVTRGGDVRYCWWQLPGSTHQLRLDSLLPLQGFIHPGCRLYILGAGFLPSTVSLFNVLSIFWVILIYKYILFDYPQMPFHFNNRTTWIADCNSVYGDRCQPRDPCRCGIGQQLLTLC